MYVALEPYVRRFWPDGILGWTRLLSGYVRDPRVGRDVLIGCVFAAAMALLSRLRAAAAAGWAARRPSRASRRRRAR